MFEKSMFLLGESEGFIVLGAFGALYFAVAFITNKLMVRSTHDFMVAGRQVGLAMGTAGLISTWTWVVAILVVSAQTFNFGLSGWFWFTVPNGLAIMAVIPIGSFLRRRMPRGYTISEFIGRRFDTKMHLVFVAVQIFWVFTIASVNAKGGSLVFGSIFGINGDLVAGIVLGTVIIYSIFGGLWTSATTGTIQTMLLTVPAFIVAAFAINAVGGVGPIVDALHAKPGGINIFDINGVTQFGLLFAFTLFAATIPDQSYWQKVWGIRRKFVESSFLYGGGLFYPIPLATGVLGFIAIVIGADVATDLGGDPGAAAPFALSNIDVPTAIPILFSIMLLAAAFSTLDAGLLGLGSVVGVDLIKKYIGPRSIFKSDAIVLWTAKISMIGAGAAAMGMVLSDVDLTRIFFFGGIFKNAILFPVVMAIFWKDVNKDGIFVAVVVAIAAGLPVFLASPAWFDYFHWGTLHDLWSYTIVWSITLFVPIVWTLIWPQPYDWNLLKQRTVAPTGGGRPPHNTTANGNNR